MRDDERRNGWILVLAVAVGMALGALLAFWVAGLTARTAPPGQPSAEAGDPGSVDVLQVLQAFSPLPAAVALPVVDGGPGADGYPRILLVALPSFGPRQRAFLFIRPADPGLCRALHGTELATYWDDHEPIGICVVGDPPSVAPPARAIDFLRRRSS